MTRKQKRLAVIAGGLAILGSAVGLIAFALSDKITFFYTPSDVAEKAVEQGRRIRLGGMVEKGSFQRAPGSMEAHFRVTDGDAQLPVMYDKILPDLFREGQAVVATGTMRDGVFVAENVLAKHDETYMPKEVADKMGAAHKKHDVPAAKEAAP